MTTRKPTNRQEQAAGAIRAALAGGPLDAVSIWEALRRRGIHYNPTTFHAVLARLVRRGLIHSLRHRGRRWYVHPDQLPGWARLPDTEPAVVHDLLLDAGVAAEAVARMRLVQGE